MVNSDQTSHRAENAIDKLAASERELESLRNERRLHLLLLAQAQEELETLTKRVERSARPEGEAGEQAAPSPSQRVDLARLVHERDAHSERITGLEGEKTALLDRISVLLGMLSQADEQQTRLLEENRREIEERGRLAERIARLQSDEANVSERISVLDAEVAKTSLAREEQARLAEERRGVLESLLKERDAQARLIAQLEEGKNEVAERASVLTADLAKVRLALEEQVRVADQRRGAVEALLQERDAQARRIAQLKEDKNALAERASVLNADLATVRLAHEEQVRAAEEGHRALEATLQERDGLARHVVGLEDARNTLAEQVSVLDASLGSVKLAHAEQVRLAEERRDAVESLAQERDKQARHIAGLEDDKNALAERLAALGATLASVKLAHEEQVRVAEERRDTLESLAERVSVLDTDLARVRLAYEEQARVAEERRDTLESIAQERGKQTEQIAQLVGERNALSERISGLEANLVKIGQLREEQARAAEERRDALESIAQERGKQAEQIAQLVGEKKALSERISGLEADLAKIAQSREEQTRAAEEQRGALESLAQERDKQVKQITQLEAEKNARSEQISALEADLAKAGQSREEQARAAEERRGTVESLAQERDRHIAQLEGEKNALAGRGSALEADLAKAGQMREEQTRAAEEQRRVVESLAQERDRQAKHIAQLEGEKNVLAGRISALEADLAKAGQSREEQARAAEERRGTVESLAQDRDRHIAQLEGEKNALAGRGSALEADLAKAGQMREEQTRAAEEQRRVVESLAQERDRQAKHITQLEGEKNALAGRISALEADLAKAGQSREEQTRLAEERRSEIERLAQQRDELNFRQKLLDDEVVKAEAQIELIKDVLLREKAH